MHRVLYETGRPQLRGYAGLLALGAGVTFLYNDSHKTSLNKSTFSCQCAAELPLPVANPKEGHFLDSFKNWLESKHCETSGVDIRASVKTPTAGLGVFLAEEENKSRFQYTWWQWCKSWIISQPDIVLMRIPLENRISVDTICKDPKLGKLYRTLQENGAVTDRQIIMLFLIVERIRGSDSEWVPYFGLLPQAFNTPLFYGKAEMDELNGTTLHTATRVLKDSLKAQWSVIGPYAEQILRELGPLTQGMSATIDDLFWAHSVFWSRSLNWPAPIQKDSQLRSEGEGNKGTRPEEAIIPGIDFCNHSENPVCQWSVWNSALLEGGESKSVGLVCNRKTKLKPGDELTISYGDKSNEEFLMQYGFTLNKNPRDNLMIALDLGPKAEWNSAIEAKMQLLINKGLGPQIFLTQEELQAQSRSDCTLEQVGLKSETWEVLETLIMNDEDALAALEVLNRSGDKIDTEGCPEYTPLSSDFSSQDQMEGRRLALLTTITRILDAKVQELELGTGPLENDVKLIEAADSATLPQVYSCVVYRAGQKRLARGFQAKAKKALARQMVHMQALQSKKY